jgi:uncharacterized protein (DUF1015 family)
MRIMVRVIPFQGLRYDLERVGSLSDVTAPPYDVITQEDQAALYAQHPANVVRLILNQPTPEDTADENVYTRAAWFLNDWVNTGVVRQDDTPQMLAYEQTYQGHTRRGLIALMKLESFETGEVLPHEFTLGGPKADRLKLMQHTLANLSQIFMIYDDPSRLLEEGVFPQLGNQWAEAVDPHEVSHRVQPITQPDALAKLEAMFAEQVLLIADGHHRYETALTFRDVVRERLNSTAPDGALASDYVMVFLTNLHDPGLQVYPTHRVFKAWPTGWDRARFEAALLGVFDVVAPGNAIFTVEFPDKILPVALKDPQNALAAVPDVMRDLDVVQLDAVVFQQLLGHKADELKEMNVLRFYREDDAPQTMLSSGKAVVAFRMAAPSVADVRNICQAGYRMPQKSTFFYPKILSGLVLYSYQHPHPQVQPIPSHLFQAEAPV